MKPKTETEEKAQKKTPYEPPAFEKRERLEEVVDGPLPSARGCRRLGGLCRYPLCAATPGRRVITGLRRSYRDFAGADPRGGRRFCSTPPVLILYPIHSYPRLS